MSLKDLFLFVPLGLVLVAYLFPYWDIWFNAPMYGHTWFEISVYPTGVVTGFLWEVNIMNHYVGIPPLEPEKMVELKALPFVWVALAVFISLAWLWRWSRKGFLAWLLALAVLVSLPAFHWYWLYIYLNTREPLEAINPGYVPPILIGSDRVANIDRLATFDLGYWLPVVALILTSPWISRRIDNILVKIATRKP